MKKQYIPLKIEVMPVEILSALCTSGGGGGGGNDHISSGGATGGSEGSARAPHRTPAF